MKRFKARLAARGPQGSWTHLEIPFSVEKVFGSRGRVPVAGTMNGFAFRSSVMPRGDGTHYMAVNKAMQAGARAGAGDLVAVTIDVDRTERVVAIPVELKQVLAGNRVAAAGFDALSYSHRKEFADWVTAAKKEPTRLARADKAIAMVLTRKQVR